jgi:hypothetical protein
MCLPKAPKQDPGIAQEQARQRQLELDRLAEEKDKATKAARRALPGSGARSLLSPGNSGAGFSGTGNYTA